jgi:HSP20 family protein
MATSTYRFEDPFVQLRREIDRAFQSMYQEAWGARSSAGVFPAINLYDDGESFMLRAEIPGLNKEELEVSAKADQVVLRGKRAIAAPGQDANYHRREREEGTFRRTVVLPQPINPNEVTASYTDGVLEIVMPRAEQAVLRKIAIK